MMLEIDLQSGVLCNTLHAVYRRSEFSLEYRQRKPDVSSPPSLANQIDLTLGVRQEANVLAIADTLVLTFEGRTKALVSIEAYTNCENWALAHWVAPKVTGFGTLLLGTSIADDRIDLGVLPAYTFFEAEKVLQISLCDDLNVDNSYRVSDRLVVGVNSRRLVVLLIEGLSME